MHDLSVRLASAFLCSGILLFIGFLIYSALYPRKVHAAGPSPAPVHAKDYGMLAPVARPLEWTIREVEEHVTRSWGWAIVVTTFLVNLALFPFRVLAARSAQRIKAIQPMVDAINARYKSKGSGPFQADPEHQKELTDLYRTHQVNPLGGCVPMLAPFAVLAAFYSVIRGLAELHGAHWLWIADLSQPEQLAVRVLPVLMIATQLVIGQITPVVPGADPRMARLTKLMPLLFGAAFYGQPAALMLYWLASNLLQLAQQWWLTKRYA
jgi:YidC/Oxa1 family membrane protein insertase